MRRDPGRGLVWLLALLAAGCQTDATTVDPPEMVGDAAGPDAALADVGPRADAAEPDAEPDAAEPDAACEALPCDGECAAICPEPVCPPEPPRPPTDCPGAQAAVDGICPPIAPEPPRFEAVVCPAGWQPVQIAEWQPVACEPQPESQCATTAVWTGAACERLGAACPDGGWPDPAEVPSAFAGRRVFVAPTGQADAAGTADDPQSLAGAAAHAEAGDALLLAAGDYTFAGDLPGVALLGACATQTTVTGPLRISAAAEAFVQGVTLQTGGNDPALALVGVARATLHDVVLAGLSAEEGALAARRVVSTRAWALREVQAEVSSARWAMAAAESALITLGGSLSLVDAQLSGDGLRPAATPAQAPALLLAGPAELTRVQVRQWPGHGLRVLSEAVSGQHVAVRGAQQACAVVEATGVARFEGLSAQSCHVQGGVAVGLGVAGQLTVDGLAVAEVGRLGATLVQVDAEALLTLRGGQLDGRGGQGDGVLALGAAHLTDIWIGASTAVDARDGGPLTLVRAVLDASVGGVRLGRDGVLTDLRARAQEPLSLMATTPDARVRVERAVLIAEGRQVNAALNAQGQARLVLADVDAHATDQAHGVRLTEVDAVWLDRVRIDAPETEMHGGLDVNLSHAFVRDLRLTHGETLRGQGGLTLFQESCLRACRVGSDGSPNVQLYVASSAQARVSDVWLRDGRPLFRGNRGVGLYVEGLMEAERLRISNNVDVGVTVTRQGVATLRDVTVEGTRIAPLCTEPGECGRFPFAQAAWADGEGTRLSLSRFHLSGNEGIGVRLTNGAQFERSQGLMGPNLTPEGRGFGLMVSADQPVGDDGDGTCIYESFQVDDGSRPVPMVSVPESPRPVGAPPFVCFAWDLPCDAPLPRD